MVFFFKKVSVLGTLFLGRPPGYKTDPPSNVCIVGNGHNTDTRRQQRFSYLAYIASLSIIYQHVEVYTWVHTFLFLN